LLSSPTCLVITHKLFGQVERGPNSLVASSPVWIRYVPSSRAARLVLICLPTGPHYCVRYLFREKVPSGVVPDYTNPLRKPLAAI
jgi:hypothetical protein